METDFFKPRHHWWNVYRWNVWQQHAKVYPSFIKWIICCWLRYKSTSLVFWSCPLCQTDRLRVSTLKYCLGWRLYFCTNISRLWESLSFAAATQIPCEMWREERKPLQCFLAEKSLRALHIRAAWLAAVSWLRAGGCLHCTKHIQPQLRAK